MTHDDRSRPAIEFRNVSIGFEEGVWVLQDVSFALGVGEMLVVTGASGSGKSVLLRVADGFYPPDEGEVLIEGCHIEKLGEDELLALRSGRIGFVFQEEALFTSMSTYDNTAFRLVEHNWSEEETDRTVREILRFVGLEQDLQKLPEELSIGMRRRLELARALAGWPPVMFYDEPTSGLDPINAKGVMNLIIRARDVNKNSSIYVTKELHEIPYLATHYAAQGPTGEVVIREGKELGAATTRVLALDRGKIAFLGTAEAFFASSLPAITRLTHPEAGRTVSKAPSLRRPLAVPGAVPIARQ